MPFETYPSASKPHEVGLLHGKMRSEDKAAVMQRFKAGEVGVLVSTTVIEVGVDVPNATVMLVQHADRFGLSQLHQLRGRVGRGEHRGTCLLVAGDASKDGWARLQVLAQTTDGFVVAERDLELRGPGEMLGTRQSGLPDLVVANLARDGRLVEQAKEVSERLLSQDPELSAPEHRRLHSELMRRFGERLKLTKAGDPLSDHIGHGQQQKKHDQYDQREGQVAPQAAGIGDVGGFELIERQDGPYCFRYGVGSKSPVGHSCCSR